MHTSHTHTHTLITHTHACTHAHTHTHTTLYNIKHFTSKRYVEKDHITTDAVINSDNGKLM